MAVFSRHNDYVESDEMRRGMYLREYTALKEIIRDTSVIRSGEGRDSL
ncbi:MAG: hypothetical protein IJS80_03825 [Lachnospiraceae bacterium]|nr:hypothetical protein [Lachnospiraceae bacterium]